MGINRAIVNDSVMRTCPGFAGKANGVGFRTTALSMLVIAALACIVITAPVLGADRVIVKKQHPIKDEYLVVFRSDVSTEDVPGLARALANEHGTQPVKIWTRAVKGFYARMPAGRAEALRRHPLVDFVEENGRTFTSSVTMPTDRDPATCALPNGQNCPATTDNRLWFLDRIDQDSPVPSKSFSYCATGASVKVYVVDLGVQGNHSEFLDSNGNSRVATGKNASNDPFPANDPCGGWPVPSGTGSLANQTDPKNYNGELNAGHGTGVASLAAGKKIGIAKDAAIIPVKVGRCDGYKTRYRTNGALYNVGDWVHDVQPSGSLWRLHKRWKAVSAGRASTIDAKNWTPNGNGQFIDDNPNDSDPGVVWQEQIVPSDEAEYQTTEMLIDGLEWVLADRVNLTGNPKTAAIATLSVWEPILATGVLGTGSSVQQAVRNLIADNVTVIASANNQSADACLQAPGAFSRFNPVVNRRDQVITVGGSMLLNDPEQASYDSSQPTRDARWTCTGASCPAAGFEGAGSNAGPCVTLFAPAKGIAAAQRRNATDYRDRASSNGSSWSAPLVAGVAAGYLQSNSTLTPEGVYNLLLSRASDGILDDATLDTADVTYESTPNQFLRAGDVSITAHPQDTSSTSSNHASLSVTATGTGPFSYQWFQVNPEFVSTSRRGAADSFPLTGQTGSSLSIHPEEETGYWVRVSGCGAADSDIAYVTPVQNAPVPTGLNAETNPNRTVTVSWNSVGADEYVIERKVGSTDWAQLQVVPGTSRTFVDVTIPLSSAALYRVYSRMNGSTEGSARSNVDFGHGWQLTDLVSSDPISVKALHVTELRSILNQITDTAGLGRRYDDDAARESALSGFAVDDSDFTGLLAKINDVRDDFGLAWVAFRIDPVLGDTTPVSPASIRKTHIEDLRNGLK